MSLLWARNTLISVSAALWEVGWPEATQDASPGRNRKAYGMSFLTLAASAAFLCTPVAVWDGDGPIWCAEGPKIRLGSIAARELDGSCRAGHPCPRSSGVESRDALVALLGGAKGRLSTGHVKVSAPQMRCRASHQSYGRVVASCRLSDGRDLGAAMLRTGTVVRWR